MKFKDIIRLLEDTETPDSGDGFDVLDEMEKTLIENGSIETDKITIDQVKDWVNRYGADWCIGQLSKYSSSLSWYPLHHKNPEVLKYITGLVEKFSDGYKTLIDYGMINVDSLSLQDIETVSDKYGFDWLVHKVERYGSTPSQALKTFIRSKIDSNPAEMMMHYKRILRQIYNNNELKQMLASLSREVNAELLKNDVLPANYFPEEFIDTILPKPGEDKNIIQMLRSIKMSSSRGDYIQQYGKPVTLKLGRSAPLRDEAAIKVPFEYAQYILSTPTLTNIMRYILSGVKFENIYIADKSGDNRLSFFITGKAPSGDPIIYGRVETSSRAAGQTKLYTSKGTAQANQLNIDKYFEFHNLK